MKQLLAFVLLAAMAGFGSLILQEQSDDLRDAQVVTCNRIKQDRVDNARAWTRAMTTWQERANDLELSFTERERARQTSAVYSRTANRLRSRLFKCVPLIRDGKGIIDREAVREALNPSSEAKP